MFAHPGSLALESLFSIFCVNGQTSERIVEVAFAGDICGFFLFGGSWGELKKGSILKSRIDWVDTMAVEKVTTEDIVSLVRQ